MKYEYTVMMEKGLNSPPEFEVQERLKEEFADWEVVSANTETGLMFKDRDGLSHIPFTTIVVLRRFKKREEEIIPPVLTAECKA